MITKEKNPLRLKEQAYNQIPPLVKFVVVFH